MATNDARVDEGVAECDVHAQVLGAVHQEFVDFGLVPQQQQQHPRLLTQSPAGAFPPLRYGDGDVGGGRVVAVRALAMFDDLIVNATATSPRAASNEDGDLGDGEVRRRIKLNVSTWSSLFSPGEAKPANAGGEEQEEERVEGAGDRGGSERFHQPRHQERNGETAAPPVPASGEGAASGTPVEKAPEAGRGGSNLALAATAAAAAANSSVSPMSSSREAFRSRVRSGLLLHLCPPPGPFADLFGCGDELRQRVLGVLGARDLATFVLTSRSAAVSAASNALWAPLLQADFPDSEQREGADQALPPSSSLDRAYHHRRRRRSSASGGGGGEGEGGGGSGGVQEGRLWRCYGELERRRRRREAKRRAQARDRSRAMQLMAFMGRRSRAPYPAGLPHGPYHTPGPPLFPGYDWGPGIGDAADVSPLSPPPPPSSIWGRGGWAAPLRGWGRAPWRR